jgi:hypothetical protein
VSRGHPGVGREPPRPAQDTDGHGPPPRPLLNEAVLPFYVLHETVVVAVDLGVRRTPVTRALFGLKPHSA